MNIKLGPFQVEVEERIAMGCLIISPMIVGVIAYILVAIFGGGK